MEGSRLALLASLALLDTLPEPEFDAIAEEATRATGYEAALITLMDADRCWFKAATGILAVPGAPREVPRGMTYCQHALGSSGFFVIPDGLSDPRVSHLPSVNGPGGFRAYAGVQLILPEGLSVGSMCVVNREPRTPTADDHATLRRLADQVLQLIANRRLANAAGASRDTLLIADDDDGVRMLLVNRFERRGVRVLVASDGTEALRLYHENSQRIAFVLTDFQMPGVNGLELVRLLNEQPHPPVCLVMSGALDDAARDQLMAAGARKTLNKPFSRADLDILGEIAGSLVKA